VAFEGDVVVDLNKEMLAVGLHLDGLVAQIFDQFSYLLHPRSSGSSPSNKNQGCCPGAESVCTGIIIGFFSTGMNKMDGDEKR